MSNPISDIEISSYWDTVKSFFASSIDLCSLGVIGCGTSYYGEKFTESFSEEPQVEILSDVNKPFDHQVEQIKSGAYMLSYSCWGLDFLSKKNIINIGGVGLFGMHITALVRYTYGLMDAVGDAWKALNLKDDRNCMTTNYIKEKKFIIAVIDFALYACFYSYSLVKLAGLVSAVAFTALSNVLFFTSLVCLISLISCKIMFKEANAYTEAQFDDQSLALNFV